MSIWVSLRSSSSNGVVVTLYVASTRTLRPSPRKPLYTHSEHGRDDSRLRPPRHARMDQVHPRHRSAAARFLYTWPSTHYYRQRRHRCTPIPTPRLYSLHITPLNGFGPPLCRTLARNPPPQPRDSLRPRASARPLPLPKLRDDGRVRGGYQGRTFESSLAGGPSDWTDETDGRAGRA